MNGKVVYRPQMLEILGKRDTINNQYIWSIASNNLNHIFAGSGNGRNLSHH